MNQASGDPDYIAQVEAVANLDQWMRWFAVEALIANGETNASNGADDDYSMYRGRLTLASSFYRTTSIQFSPLVMAHESPIPSSRSST